jgi:aspartate racemase
VETRENPLIGIIGGVGPYAGVDFFKNILDNTVASRDQDHVSALLISCPAIVPDRTEYLLGQEAENPALGLFECAKRLYSAGSKYVCVNCNTAHARRIFEPFTQMAAERLPNLVIVNMIETCALYIKQNMPAVRKIGYIATRGTHASGVYHEYIGDDDGLTLIEPDEHGRERVHEAIYSEEFGIKAHSNPVSGRARRAMSLEILKLLDRGAQAVILGCTEIPLAVSPDDFTIPLLDAGKLAARRLIALAAPEKLKPPPSQTRFAG